MSKGILYVMSTIVPGLIVIGRTETENYYNRMEQLENNGYRNVVGLHREFAIEVDGFEEKEGLLRAIFSKSNVRDSELFAIDLRLVKYLLSSFRGRQIYPESEETEIEDHVCENSQEEECDDNIVEDIRSLYETIDYPSDYEHQRINYPENRAPRFRFRMVGIHPGEELTYRYNHAIKVKVINDTQVSYNQKSYSLSKLAQELSGSPSSLQGPLYFEYNGRLLTDLRREVDEQRIRNV